MLNHITIMGRLVADPELRTTPQGVTVATMRLAVDRDFKNKQTGERETDFINVVAWRQTAEFVSRFFTKGRMAVVEGRLQIRDWTDREGNKRRSAEVIADNVYFGDSKRDAEYLFRRVPAGRRERKLCAPRFLRSAGPALYGLFRPSHGRGPVRRAGRR